jgi:hypothetical protein
MGLKELYESAASGDAANTYVNANLAQRFATGATGTNITGVNFFDGDRVPRTNTETDEDGNETEVTAPDEYQTQFIRNPAGAYRYGGSAKVPGIATAVGAESAEAPELTSWTRKALNIAFGSGTHPRFGQGNMYKKFSLKTPADRVAPVPPDDEDTLRFHRYQPPATSALNTSQYNTRTGDEFGFSNNRGTPGVQPPRPGAL